MNPREGGWLAVKSCNQRRKRTEGAVLFDYIVAFNSFSEAVGTQLGTFRHSPDLLCLPTKSDFILEVADGTIDIHLSMLVKHLNTNIKRDSTLIVVCSALG
jgi:hypothetical protein